MTTLLGETFSVVVLPSDALELSAGNVKLASLPATSLIVPASAPVDAYCKRPPLVVTPVALTPAPLPMTS